MKILFVARNPSLYLQYERVMRGLLDAGHTLEFHLDSMEWRNAKMDAAVLDRFQEESGGLFTYKPAVRPSGLGASILRNKREIMNYAAYAREDLPISGSPYMKERQCHALYRPWDILMRTRLLHSLVLKRDGLQWLSALESWIKPNRDVTEAIEASQPDLVVATPFIFARSRVETEYVKCAKALGIPTAVTVFSWDNLTSKGIFQILPDSILMWNEHQVKELESIHKVNGDRAFCTGAPSLDFWFEQKPRQTKAEFCSEHGLDPERPYVVYLCSSQTIAKTENEFVTEFVAHLRARLGNECPSILIRPHPLNIDIWSGWDVEGTAIVPKENRDIFYSTDARALFFETLHHSCCVMGLNTTAMVETAIVGKPCLTLLVDRFADTQELSGHFHHLTDAGFMHCTRSLDETADEIKAMAQGADPYRAAREAFVKDFVRPHGVQHASAAVMQRTLELLGEGHALSEVRRQVLSELEAG